MVKASELEQYIIKNKAEEFKQFIVTNKLEWYYHRYLDGVFISIPLNLLGDWNKIISDYFVTNSGLTVELRNNYLFLWTKDILDCLDIDPAEIFGLDYEKHLLKKD